ncbi:hypothetical protein BJY52DRAFT_1299178, partial [Lactarius psammicola]
MEKRLKPTTKLCSKACQRIWTGVPTFAGLFAAVLTSFLVDSLQNLQPDPAQQSVYYHQQSVTMLAQISQQIASIAPQVSVPSTPPPPYPTFHPSSRRHPS